jgi:iron complex transport system ATP-binding protein
MFADRVALMSKGVIFADGPPGEVIDPAVIAATYGVNVRVLAHPQTGRPVVVPDIAAYGVEALAPKPQGATV